MPPAGLMGRNKMPGDMGKPVVIPSDRQEESKEKFKIHQFNLVASEMMSLNRTLPDYRIPGYVTATTVTRLSPD